MVDARLREGHRREHSSESLSRAGLWRAAPGRCRLPGPVHIRPGMAYPGGVLVLAFSPCRVGMERELGRFPDDKHFSVDGR